MLIKYGNLYTSVLTFDVEGMGDAVSLLFSQEPADPAREDFLVVVNGRLDVGHGADVW